MPWSSTIQNIASGDLGTWRWQALGAAGPDGGPLNEIVAAVNERSRALSGADAFEPFVIGDACQGRSAVYQLQRWIKDNYTRFCPRKDPDDAFALIAGPGYYTGRDDVPTWADYSWGQFCESAGCGTVAAGNTGFRRVQGDAWPQDWTDRDDPAFSFGMVNGENWTPDAGARDVVGPWVLADLYGMLNELRWVKVGSGGLAWSIAGLSDMRRSGYGMALTNWEDAQADARDSTEDGYEGNPVLENFGALPPQAWSRLVLVSGGPFYQATARRQRAYCRLSGTLTGAPARGVDWYASVAKTEHAAYGANAFAAYADPHHSPSGDHFTWSGGSHGPVVLWLTDAENTDEQPLSSECLGEYDETARPQNMPGGRISPWPAEPSELDIDNAAGWQAVTFAAVLRYDVAGGFGKVI